MDNNVKVISAVRQDVVEALVQSAFKGMEVFGNLDETTGGEVLSAIMTMALRMVVYTKSQGEPQARAHNIYQVRQALARILTECADETKLM
jgi:hypothetical protein